MNTFQSLINKMPGRWGMRVRDLYWSRQFGACEGSLRIEDGCRIEGAQNISMGSDIGLMSGTMIFAHDGGRIQFGSRIALNVNVIVNAAENGQIIMKNDIIIGPNSIFRAANHKYRKKEKLINEQGHEPGLIVIEDDVWIGAGVVVLPNVTIGQGAVVGAGAVVTKDVQAFSLVGGVPARIIKENCRIG